MGVEVKSGGEGVIVADRGCNDGLILETYPPQDVT
jgi:hypothetical protein